MNIMQDKSKFKCTVSSVLNKEVKQYGKQFMYDNRNDTSWCSDHGVPQWILVGFEEPTKITDIKIQFQGGFAGKDSLVYFHDKDGNLIAKENIYPEDINSIQNFSFKSDLENITKLKIVFETSTDFFGRIIVYNLEICS